MELDDPTANTEVLLTQRTGHVLVLTLNRPRSRNALNPELKDAILQATAEADQDSDVRAVVRHHRERPGLLRGDGPEGVRQRRRLRRADDFCQDGIGKPLIAALNGPALGGGTTVATPDPPGGRAGREARRQRPPRRRPDQEADPRAPPARLDREVSPGSRISDPRSTTSSDGATGPPTAAIRSPSIRRIPGLTISPASMSTSPAAFNVSTVQPS